MSVVSVWAKGRFSLRVARHRFVGVGGWMGGILLCAGSLVSLTSSLVCKHRSPGSWLLWPLANYVLWQALYLVLMFGVQALGFGFRCRAWGFGFRVWGFRFKVSGLGFRVQGSGFKVSGFGLKVSGLRFRA